MPSGLSLRDYIALEAAGSARHYCAQLARLGLFCKETHGNVIRLAPPLVITRDEIDGTLERIEAVFCG